MYVHVFILRLPCLFLEVLIYTGKEVIMAAMHTTDLGIRCRIRGAKPHWPEGECTMRANLSHIR
jgi:hypothetical protein